jgi:ferredoxin-NADP reductase/Na+-translocating ferredoxin:NAD+ oxidoreductase RnfD subunit
MNQPFKFIDSQLNRLTTYLFVTVSLILILISALILSVFHELPQSAGAIIASILVLTIICCLVNRLCSIIWHVNTNKESWLITALILALIIPPTTLSLHYLFLIAIAGLTAMLSKYVLVFRRHHLFNPAAIAMLILGITKILPATWWVGSPALFVPVLIIGLLVLRKIRHFQLFTVYIVMAIVMAFFAGLDRSQQASYILHTALLSSPLIFFGTIMLTEPETLPASNWQQLIYAFIAGILFSSQLRLGSVSTTPELVLIVVNIYSIFVSPKRTIPLKLKSFEEISPYTYQASFISDGLLNFKAGQYATINLKHPHSDARGVRRSFSIASAPGSNELVIAYKIPVKDRASTFKKALAGLHEGDSISASSIAGTFTLPDDQKQKLVFIAGGIGITPFLSMLKELVIKKQNRDVILFYFISDENELNFVNSFNAARSYGLKLIPVFSSPDAKAYSPALRGRLNEADIKKAVPDFSERDFFISGPPVFVDAYKSMLAKLAISRRRIQTDHFSGY